MRKRGKRVLEHEAPLAPLSSHLDERSRALRHLAIDALEGGARGHIGSTLSLIEIMRVLYDDVMVHQPENPAWDERDRLILSKGHGCIAQYVMLAEHGYFDVSQLSTFCRYESILGGHPERGHVPGIEASTGALGHGLAIGVGLAVAARIRGASHRVFVVMGDGELDEGSVWESAIASAHHRLEHLVVIVDYNHFQSFGPIADVWNLEPLAAKFQAFGFHAVEVDGHDVAALRRGLTSTVQGMPLAVIAHTIKGRGVGFAEGSATWHHKSSLKSADITALRAAVDL